MPEEKLREIAESETCKNPEAGLELRGGEYYSLREIADHPRGKEAAFRVNGDQTIYFKLLSVDGDACIVRDIAAEILHLPDNKANIKLGMDDEVKFVQFMEPESSENGESEENSSESLEDVIEGFTNGAKEGFFIYSGESDKSHSILYYFMEDGFLVDIKKEKGGYRITKKADLPSSISDRINPEDYIEISRILRKIKYNTVVRLVFNDGTVLEKPYITQAGIFYGYDFKTGEVKAIVPKSGEMPEVEIDPSSKKLTGDDFKINLSKYFQID